MFFFFIIISYAIFSHKIINYFGRNRVDRNKTRGLRNYGTKVRRKIHIGEKVA